MARPTNVLVNNLEATRPHTSMDIARWQKTASDAMSDTLKQPPDDSEIGLSRQSSMPEELQS